MKPIQGVPRFVVVLSTIVLLFSAMGWSADEDKDRSEIEKRIDASAKVLTEIMATPDKAIPNKVIERCQVSGDYPQHGQDCHWLRR